METYELLNRELYGMTRVKEALVQFAINRHRNPKAFSMLGLCSKPGMGKTSIAIAFAKAMGLPIKRFSLGSLNDRSLLMGSNGVWVGATPSLLLQALKEMGACNGCILFDEVEKAGKDVQYALLHITDQLQNDRFADALLSEYTHDLSELVFLFAMNNKDWLDPALRDRMDILDIDDHTLDDIYHIVTDFSLPSILKNSGLNKGDVTITRQACYAIKSIISAPGGQDNGVRPINKILKMMVSKISMYNEWIIASKNSKPKLSYKVPNFAGYPYIINREVVTALCKDEYRTDFLSMYC